MVGELFRDSLDTYDYRLHIGGPCRKKTGNAIMDPTETNPDPYLAVIHPVDHGERKHPWHQPNRPIKSSGPLK